MVADYAGMGLTIGRHPMALRRDELATRGVSRAIDLHSARHGRRVRVQTYSPFRHRFLDDSDNAFTVDIESAEFLE